jgi:hypothetical protein
MASANRGLLLRLVVVGGAPACPCPCRLSDGGQQTELLPPSSRAISAICAYIVAPRGKGKSSHIPHADMLSLPFDINLVVHLQSSRFCESTFAGDTCGGKLLHRCIV